MEDALAQEVKAQVVDQLKSLNPCCNGRCTRTNDKKKIGSKIQSLNPCCNGRCTRTNRFVPAYVKSHNVLILVVMEDALALGSVIREMVQTKVSLNPCCNGRCTRT